MKAPDAGRPIYITIRPLHEEAGVRRHGRFCVYCDGRRMCISDDPLRDTARGFLKVGVPPNVVLIVRHDLGLYPELPRRGRPHRSGPICSLQIEFASYT